MFIRIGIGKFIVDFGERRKEKDRREGKDRRARHFIMDDEDRREDEERRERERRASDPFPENGSSTKGPETSAHYQDEQDHMDGQASLPKKEKTPRKWRK